MIVKERSVSEHSNRPLDRIGRRADRIARQVQPSLKPSPSPKCHQVPPAQEVHQRLLHSTWLCGAWCWFISFLLWEEIMAVNLKVKPYMVELLLLPTLFALFLQPMMNDRLHHNHHLHHQLLQCRHVSRPHTPFPRMPFAICHSDAPFTRLDTSLLDYAPVTHCACAGGQ